MFARFLLGDLFIHGIGGAKYDELGDEIARRFFGIEPPGFLTLSLTLWLGLPTDPATPADLAAVERQLRDLTFNPDRHLHEPYPDELRNLISGKREAIAGPVTSRRERVARAMAIRRCNEAMQPWVEAMRADLAIAAADRSGRRCGRTGSPATASLRWCSTRAAGFEQVLRDVIGAPVASRGRIPLGNLRRLTRTVGTDRDASG